MTIESKVVYSAELDENIRNVMRSLKGKIASTGIAREVDDADVTGDQAARVRELLANGLYPDRADAVLGRLPRRITDNTWVSRYNNAIVKQDYELAMKILVNKEDAATVIWSRPYDSLTLSWYAPPNADAVRYCKLWYKTDAQSTVFNGYGLFLDSLSNTTYSPLVVDVAALGTQAGIYSLKLYGYLQNKSHYFYIEYFDAHDQSIGGTNTYNIQNNLADIAYYRIHYTTDLASNVYNGYGLAISVDGDAMISPINVAVGTEDSRVVVDDTVMSLKLYGDMDNTIYKFATQAVYRDGSFGDIVPVRYSLDLVWSRPELVGIQKYLLTYTINDRDDVNLFDAHWNPLSTTIELDVSQFSNINLPNLVLYSDMQNALYKFTIYAVAANQMPILVTTITTGGDTNKAKRNEFCDIMRSRNADVFNDYDRLNALLWYLNYAFFFSHKNWWAVYQMIEERKCNDTIFPITAPMYFPPAMKNAWERQAPDEQHVTYIEQEIKVPIYGTVTEVTGERTVQVGYIRINQNLIGQYIVMMIDGEPGSRVIQLGTPTLTEDYEEIATIVDLQERMVGSGIGDVYVEEVYAECLIDASPFQTYQRGELQVTRAQESVFIYAYYGSVEAAGQDLDAFALDLGAERRIRMEKWEDIYQAWLAIHKGVFETWQQILELNPLSIVVDVSNLLRNKLVPRQTGAVTSVGNAAISENAPLMRDGEIPEAIMQRIVDIIKEDDVITPVFTDYMDNVYEYLAGVSVDYDGTRANEKTMNEALDRKARALAGEKEGVQIDVFRLPAFWDLQKVSLLKFNDAAYWRDLAEFNDIANPLDEVEMYEGRRLGLPRMAEERALSGG